MPHSDAVAVSSPTAQFAPAGAKPSVVVPADEFVYPDRKRVFYRVQVGDTLKEIAAALKVGVDDLDRWNDIDPSARLQEGMTLQAYVPQSADLSHVVVASESEVRVMPLGSEEFFASLEHDRGMKRVVVAAKIGRHARGDRQAVQRARPDDGAREPARPERRAEGGGVDRGVRAGRDGGTDRDDDRVECAAAARALPAPPVPDLLP